MGERVGKGLKLGEVLWSWDCDVCEFVIGGNVFVFLGDHLEILECLVVKWGFWFSKKN